MVVVPVYTSQVALMGRLVHASRDDKANSQNLVYKVDESDRFPVWGDNVHSRNQDYLVYSPNDLVCQGGNDVDPLDVCSHSDL